MAGRVTAPAATARERRWEREKLRLAYAAETRRFEIERFWQRSLFFWTVLGAAFVGYGVIEGKSRDAQIVLSCFGFIAALAWTLQNRGAKYWQEAWEQKTRRVQRAVLQSDLFSGQEALLPKGAFGAARYSVSRIAIMLSDFTLIVWMALTARAAAPEIRAMARHIDPFVLKMWDGLGRDWIYVALAGTMTFALMMLSFGLSDLRGGKKED